MNDLNIKTFAHGLFIMHKAQYMLHVWHTRVAFMLAKTALYTKHSERIEKNGDEKNTKVMRMTERKAMS